jgi:lipopolysaccharide transport system ATP-binding protein
MPIIEVDHVTKEYRLGALQGLKQTVLNAGARLSGKKVEEPPLFKALDDVSFSIEAGEVVGIIGHNGAGKSTLLKMLAKISTPSHGTVKVNGKIAPLIEVGAGFVPDLTGRENVYLNGAILGMARNEIEKKFDEIVDFAEMAEFIDTPVKRYSSGMQVKLAFAVATSIEAEILIVDEVLAVGDLAFQRKCFDRMTDLIKRQGKTVLLVSHNIRQVEKLCARTMLLDHGRIVADGEPTEVCNEFFARSEDKIKHQLAAAAAKAGKARRLGTGDVELLRVRTLDSDGNETDAFHHGSDVTVQLDFRTGIDLVNPFFGVGFQTTDLLSLISEDSDNQFSMTRIPTGDFSLRCVYKKLPLLPGIYPIRAGVQVGELLELLYYEENITTLNVVSDGHVRTTALKEAFVTVPTEWYLACGATFAT